MKKLLTTLVLTLSFTASASTPYDDAVKSERKEAAQAAVKIVRLYGYRCDSISSFQPFIMGGGFTLNCNSYRYTYELEDVGGRIVVKVK